MELTKLYFILQYPDSWQAKWDMYLFDKKFGYLFDSLKYSGSQLPDAVYMSPKELEQYRKLVKDGSSKT